jgi:hypothetical protein
MARGGELADLAYPHLTPQKGAPLGKLHRHGLPIRQSSLPEHELLHGPILAGVFVVGEAGDALLLHPGEEGRAIPFPIEDHGEAMEQRIGSQFLRALLSRHVPFEARDDLLLQDLQEPGIDGLTHHEEGLAIHRVHPIVGGGP